MTQQIKTYLIIASLIIFYIYASIQVGFLTTLSLFFTWSIMSIVFRGHLELFSLFEKSCSSIYRDIKNALKNKPIPNIK